MSLRRTIIEVLATQGDHRFGRGVHYLYEAIKDREPGAASSREVMETLWQMLAEGLVYIDYNQPATENWTWELTSRGRQVAKSSDYEPDDPEGYLRRLQERIPSVDELVLSYAREALVAYGASCYLASSVMLGVASERAFQLLGEAFGAWPCRGGSQEIHRRVR